VKLLVAPTLLGKAGSSVNLRALPRPSVKTDSAAVDNSAPVHSNPHAKIAPRFRR